MIEIKITLSEYKKLLAIAYAAESVLEWQKEDLKSMQKSSLERLQDKVKAFIK